MSDLKIVLASEYLDRRNQASKATDVELPGKAVFQGRRTVSLRKSLSSLEFMHGANLSE